MTIDENTPFFVVDNSDHALTTIMDLGLLGDFEQYTGEDASHISTVIYMRHKYHWLVACHFVGHTIKNVKSPYVIFGLRKADFSIEDVNAYVDRIAKAFGSTDAPIAGFPRPDRN